MPSSWTTCRWREAIETVAMDGFSGFKTAAAEELPDATAMMDPFHVVRQAGDALDHRRRRVQQQLHGHRGRTGDPLYSCRRTLHTGMGLLTDRQEARVTALFDTDDHVDVDVDNVAEAGQDVIVATVANVRTLVGTGRHGAVAAIQQSPEVVRPICFVVILVYVAPILEGSPMLNFSQDRECASWIVDAPSDPDLLLRFGPPGFDAYARVLFLSDPDFDGQAEADGCALPGAPSPIEVLARTVDTLVEFTATPAKGYFCFWDSGVSEVPGTARSHSLVRIPRRDSFLVSGPLAEVRNWYADLNLDEYDHPSFIWPSDRSWCIAADVDPHWAGVGASASAIASLREKSAIACVGAERAHVTPDYR